MAETCQESSFSVLPVVSHKSDTCFIFALLDVISYWQTIFTCVLFFIFGFPCTTFYTYTEIVHEYFMICAMHV